MHDGIKKDGDGSVLAFIGLFSRCQSLKYTSRSRTFGIARK
jgi:hypothetical protein